MFVLFSSIQSNFKFSRYIGKLNVDNGALKLQYRVMAPLMLAASLIVTAQQFIGDQSIACIQSKESIPENVLNTYCYFIGTTTWDEDTSAFPHPGIGPWKKNVTATRHLYYQWVPYYLFLLALLFPSAHYLWKCLEKHLLVNITAGFESVRYSMFQEKSIDKIPSITERQEKIEKLSNILFARIKHSLNDIWTLKLIFVEIYALGMNLFIFWLTDKFLGGKGAFTQITFQSAIKTFPTETMCTFHKYGPSGTIQKHEALCIMPTNIVNYYIFLLFYVLMLILIVVSVLALFWRMIGACFYRFVWFNRITPFNHINDLVDSDARKTVFNSMNYFDWVFLNYIAENVDGMTFREVLLSLAREIDHQNQIIYEKKKKASEKPSKFVNVIGFKYEE